MILDAITLFAAGFGDLAIRHIERAVEECVARLIAWLVSLAGVP